MHAAVVGSVRSALEACLADGTVLRDEPWHHVSCALERGDRDQGVRRRTGSADARLRVARQALVRVEARPEAVVLASRHRLDVEELGEPMLEECGLVRGKALQRSADTRRAAAHPGVDGPSRRLTLTACADA